MPTILKTSPYRFFFYSNEGAEPAHVHVEGDGREAKIWLADMRLASSYGFRGHELHDILALARQHQKLFREAWHEHFAHHA